MYTEIFFDNDRPEGEQLTKSHSLLKKKTRRSESTIGDSNSRCCDICLEYEKYSESELIECINCQGVCHQKCQDILDSCLNKASLRKNRIKHSSCNYLCPRCIYSHKVHLHHGSLK
jgi:hypothetical protein